MTVLQMSPPRALRDDAAPKPAMKLRVSVSVMDAPSVTRTFQVADRLVIGRDPDADLSLDDCLISRRHAVLHAVDGELEVEDTSSNGTLIA